MLSRATRARSQPPSRARSPTGDATCERFHEVLLPLPFALGASGGPERRVDIVALGSGHEARNTPWAHGRRRYDIGGAARTLDELHALVAFFEARRGKLHGFRFRDFLDWKSCAPAATPTASCIDGEGARSRCSFPSPHRYWDIDSAHTSRVDHRRHADDRAHVRVGWDARPYPAFPARSDVWADGASWRRGHWLNGRAGLSMLGEVGC